MLLSQATMKATMSAIIPRPCITWPSHNHPCALSPSHNTRRSNVRKRRLQQPIHPHCRSDAARGGTRPPPSAAIAQKWPLVRLPGLGGENRAGGRQRPRPYPTRRARRDQAHHQHRALGLADDPPHRGRAVRARAAAQLAIGAGCDRRGAGAPAPLACKRADSDRQPTRCHASPTGFTFDTPGGDDAA
jgi:hypothetical protein